MEDFQNYLSALQESNFSQQQTDFNFQKKDQVREALQPIGELATIESAQTIGKNLINNIGSKVKSSLLNYSKDTLRSKMEEAGVNTDTINDVLSGNIGNTMKAKVDDILSTAKTTVQDGIDNAGVDVGVDVGVDAGVDEGESIFSRIMNAGRSLFSKVSQPVSALPIDISEVNLFLTGAFDGFSADGKQSYLDILHGRSSSGIGLTDEQFDKAWQVRNQFIRNNLTDLSNYRPDDMAGTTSNQIGDLLRQQQQTLQSTVSDVQNAVQSTVSDVQNTVQETAQNISSAVRNTTTDLMTQGETALTGGEEALTQGLNVVKSVVSDAGNIASGALTATGDAIGEAVGESLADPILGAVGLLIGLPSLIEGFEHPRAPVPLNASTQFL